MMASVFNVMVKIVKCMNKRESGMRISLNALCYFLTLRFVFLSFLFRMYTRGYMRVHRGDGHKEENAAWPWRPGCISRHFWAFSRHAWNHSLHPASLCLPGMNCIPGSMT